jgi:uncharacterized OB-fold protein
VVDDSAARANGQIRAPALIDGVHGVALGISRCVPCAAVMFPPQARCARCGSQDLASAAAPNRGELWSWTVQRFRPTAPPYDSVDTDAFEPFAVAVVMFGEDLRVVGRLDTSDPDSLRIGMPVTTVRHSHDLADGTTLATYAFRPVVGEGRR